MRLVKVRAPEGRGKEVMNTAFSLEKILPTATANVASALKLEGKGELASGSSADILVFTEDSFELREVICGGKRLFRDGSLAFK